MQTSHAPRGMTNILAYSLNAVFRPKCHPQQTDECLNLSQLQAASPVWGLTSGFFNRSRHVPSWNWQCGRYPSGISCPEIFQPFQSTLWTTSHWIPDDTASILLTTAPTYLHRLPRYYDCHQASCDDELESLTWCIPNLAEPGHPCRSRPSPETRPHSTTDYAMDLCHRSTPWLLSGTCPNISRYYPSSSRQGFHPPISHFFYQHWNTHLYIGHTNSYHLLTRCYDTAS